MLTSLESMIEWIIGLTIIGVLVLVGICIYYWNSIVILGNRISNSWSQIDVQLKRRADLVPNLIETVKGYMKHEKNAIKMVTQSRERMMKAGNIGAKVKAGNELTSALKTIFAIAENYPNLKANENFKALQDELAAIENKIAYARQFYNDSVLRYNNMITTIPGKFFASGRKTKIYLEIEAAERAVPKVRFPEA